MSLLSRPDGATRRGRRRRAAVAGCAVLLVLLATAPAGAHSGSNLVVPVLEDVVPALPPELSVEIVATQVASLLRVHNPTDEVLEVAQRDGTPWLRVSAAGVEVASGAVDTYASTNPTGASVPRDVLDGSRSNEWVRVTAEPSWAWFEHRLHPEGFVPEGAVPDATDGPVRLLEWRVPLRYGDTDVELRGSLQLRPPTGVIEVELTGDAPAGVEVQVVAGGIPGILLAPDGAAEVVVLGISGEDYLRFGDGEVLVDTASPTHRAVEAARGNALPPLDGPAEPVWETATGGERYLWLETRAQPPLDIPAEVREGDAIVELVSWQVPLRVDGEGVLLSGVTRWVPLAQASGPGGVSAEPDGAVDRWSRRLLPAGMPLVLLVMAGVALRRRGRAGRPG